MSTQKNEQAINGLLARHNIFSAVFIPVMSKLTPSQLRLLDTALAQGLISSDCHREALEWNAALTRTRENLVSKHLTSSGRQRSLDASANDLAIQIVLREIKLAEEKAGRLREKQQLAILKRRLEKLIQDGVKLKHPPPPVEEPAEEPSEEHISSLPEAARDAIECLERLQQLSESLQVVAINEHLRADSLLGDADVALCLCWSNFAPVSLSKNPGSSWELLGSLGNYRECQLLSARSAELVMKVYYSSLGLPVEDVSIRQMDGVSDDWKAFDLRVGNRLIDVKNARQSLHGNGGYVEHCVPTFKEHRASSAHVVIAGVLSPYQKEKSFYRNSFSSATVLGEVNVEKVRNLYRWAKMRFGARLDLKGIWNPGFLPGWIFEYPNEHYPKRRSTIDAIAPLLMHLSESGMNPDHLPGWMLLLCDDESLVTSLCLDERKARLVADLRIMSKAIGFSRRSLYVYAMGLALDALAAGKSPEINLREFLTLIAMTMSRRSDDDWLSHETIGRRESLLGLIDPQGYVSSLAKNLTVIAQHILESGIQLTGFRLSHPAILKGICASGETLTLMAFCGGWQTVPIRARCGTTPLTLGIDKHCPCCGHLVCHNCGHCSNACPECAPRQQGWARTVEGALSDDESWGEINIF